MNISPSSLDRREFVRKSALGLAGLTLASGDVFADEPGAKKPNIWIIMSDEHNPAIAGFAGNKIALTPNMDALAAGGIACDTHYCNSPLCSPSRSSFTAGKYVSRLSTWDNACELPSADIASLPRVLNDAGYESFLCGKQHYDYSRRYGFTEIGGNFNNTFKTGKGHRKRPTDTQQKEVSNRFNQFHPGNRNGVLEHDRKVTAGTLDFLGKRQASDKPFFLFSGYLAPHFPLIVPDEYYAKFKGKVDLPTIPPGFFETLPLNYQILRAGFGEIGVPDDVVRTGRELYYGMVNWIDGEIGKVVAKLKANPELAANTIIIYTADHGENMGERGMWWKSCMYESSARVPLVFNFPKRWAGGQRRVGASGHVDLVKTVIDLAGGKAPADWNGDSMLAWLDQPKTKWKDYAVSEYYATNIGSGYTMSRSGDWKYTYHSKMDDAHPAQRQLFNIAADPNEFTNLAEKPEHASRVTEMHQRMVAEVRATDLDAIEQRCRGELAKGYTRTDQKPDGEKGEEG